jgi:hypothetical protein
MTITNFQWPRFSSTLRISKYCIRFFQKYFILWYIASWPRVSRFLFYRLTNFRYFYSSLRVKCSAWLIQTRRRVCELLLWNHCVISPFFWKPSLLLLSCCFGSQHLNEIFSSVGTRPRHLGHRFNFILLCHAVSTLLIISFHWHFRLVRSWPGHLAQMFEGSLFHY